MKLDSTEPQHTSSSSNPPYRRIFREALLSFFAALAFFTRLPSLLSSDNYNENLFNRAAKFFPLVGILVGAVAALTFFISHLLLPTNICIILSMLASILITGAMHEDALADACDAFGGGWSKERILDIMKDSRVGSFGVVGIVVALLFKFLLLSELPSSIWIASVISAHSLSRWAAIVSMHRYDYITRKESKSTSVCQKISLADLSISLLLAVSPLLLMPQPIFGVIVIPVFITQWLISRYFAKWIGGYTGDCLGSIQQVSEIVFLLGILVIGHFVN